MSESPRGRATSGERNRQKPLAKRGKLWTAVSILAILLTILVLIVVPVKEFDAVDYFRQYEDQRINADVEETLARVKDFVKEETPLHDFSAWGDFPMRGYKYSIAFTAYGLANVAFIEPSRRAEMAYYLDRLIERMLQYDVQADWWTEGYGPDPVSENNVMYKGHLNLMYGLYELLSTTGKYESEFRQLTENIVREARSTDHLGIACEPQNYFVECNTISIYSIKLHDALYGSNHEELVNQWFRYVRDNLRDKESGLFYRVYHPITRYAVPEIISYNNGWIIAFLHGLYPDFAESLYETYKRTFIRHKFFWFAYAIYGGQVEETTRPLTVNTFPKMERRPAGFADEPDGLGSLFAFYLAMEMRDRDLYNRLLNAMTKSGVERVDTHSPAGIVKVDMRRNFAIQGPLLFGKTNIGLARLLKLAGQEKSARGNRR